MTSEPMFYEIVRACHNCKKYLRINPADAISPELINLFEKNHKNHVLVSIPLMEIEHLYEEVGEQDVIADSVVLKIIIAGEGGVGKTTILHRYVEGRFIEDTKMTIGVGFSVKNLDLGRQKVNLQLWDFSGQEHLRFMVKQHTHGAHGALFMFDLSNIRRSLRYIDDWFNILRQPGEIPIILVGAKYDIIEQNNKRYNMFKHLISESREKYDFFEYIETSSKSGHHVDDAFMTLIKKILDLREQP
jgi:small GTP-binding protein